MTVPLNASSAIADQEEGAGGAGAGAGAAGPTPSRWGKAVVAATSGEVTLLNATSWSLESIWVTPEEVLATPRL